MYKKDISYDRETRDYAMYLDGELVGFGRTYHEAEVTLDQLVFELMSGQFFSSKNSHVAPSPVDEPAADPSSTCCFCSKPHHPQTCQEMRALLFAPDSDWEFAAAENAEPDYDDSNDLLEAMADDDLAEAIWESTQGTYNGSVPAIQQRNLINAPLDLDFAPIGPEV